MSSTFVLIKMYVHQKQKKAPCLLSFAFGSSGISSNFLKESTTLDKSTQYVQSLRKVCFWLDSCVLLSHTQVQL